ncbi:MAG: zinc-ribbon domain-containing protein [Neomegalonema sp.]|nr:zinc-ribbon domain-containing protein [Neomegalonema sp.]
MIITCPDCSTRYAVENASMRDGGRTVRCSSCGCQWYEVGSQSVSRMIEADEARMIEGPAPLRRLNAPKAQPVAIIDDVQPTIDPVRTEDAPAAPYQVKTSGLPRFATMGAVMAALLTLGAGGVLLHHAGSQAGRAPLSASDYLAGKDLPDRAETLAIETAATPAPVLIVDQGYDLMEDEIGPALLLWGRVANNGMASTPTPLVRFTTYDASGAELQTGEIEVEKAVLRPQDSARFAARVRFPRDPIDKVSFEIAPKRR